MDSKKKWLKNTIKSSNKEVPLQKIKPKTKVLSKPLLWVLPAVLCLLGLALFSPGVAAAGETDTYKACAECHEDLVKAFKTKAHAVIDKKHGGHGGRFHKLRKLPRR